jgi:type VI secretion system protein ImpM
MKNCVGAFGKIPSLGDFFSINLDHSTVEKLDQWMQTALLTVSEKLGLRWDECYMNAPIWRFALCAGTVSKNHALGVMMPSVDRVGRKFPLILLTVTDKPSNVVLDHQFNVDLYEELEDIALMTLDDGSTRESLVERLNTINVEYSSNLTDLTDQDGIIQSCGKNISEINGLLLAKLICSSHKSPCMWSFVEETKYKVVISDGLPIAEKMDIFYDVDSSNWLKELA